MYLIPLDKFRSSRLVKVSFDQKEAVHSLINKERWLCRSKRDASCPVGAIKEFSVPKSCAHSVMDAAVAIKYVLEEPCGDYPPQNVPVSHCGTPNVFHKISGNIDDSTEID